MARSPTHSLISKKITADNNLLAIPLTISVLHCSSILFPFNPLNSIVEMNYLILLLDCIMSYVVLSIVLYVMLYSSNIRCAKCCVIDYGLLMKRIVFV